MTRRQKQQELECVGVIFRRIERGPGLHGVWYAYLKDEKVTVGYKMLADCIDAAYENLGGE